MRHPVMTEDRSEGTSNAAWLREQAKRFSVLATIAIVPEVKARLLEITREYEALAEKAEKRHDEAG